MLINDLLDIAKLEAGRVDFVFEPLDLIEVVDRAAAATASLFEKKRLPLRTVAGPGRPRVRGDRARLIQVVINLLSNAVKFTERGSVCCALERAEGGVILTVADTGRGIAAEDLEGIFERFKQAGDNLTEKPLGTGLGLPICRQIVERHGGRIRAASRLGEGSRFMVFLPVAGSEAGG